jgi:hypothetical protein
MKPSAPRACRAASGDLPTRLVSDWIGPHPPGRAGGHRRHTPSYVLLAGRALSVPKPGPRWGRSRATNGRSTTDNHEEPRHHQPAQHPFLAQLRRPGSPADSLSHRGSRGQILRPREDVAYDRLCRAVASCRSARLGVAITADVFRIIGRLGREEAKQLNSAQTPYQGWRGHQHEDEARRERNVRS